LHIIITIITTIIMTRAATNVASPCHTSSMNLRGAKHSSTKKKREKFKCVHEVNFRNVGNLLHLISRVFSFSLRIDMDANLPDNNYRWVNCTLEPLLIMLSATFSA
jgi:hypothetical protein